MNDAIIMVTPSETAAKYHTIQEGTCEEMIIGGNLCTLNLLQGTPYMPDISNKVLFLEDDNIMGDFFCYEFDRNLESLLQIEGANTIKGIVFGRFNDSCGLTVETIADIIQDKVPANIPVIFGVDFGHVFPMITFPNRRHCENPGEQKYDGNFHCKSLNTVVLEWVCSWYKTSHYFKKKHL